MMKLYHSPSSPFVRKVQVLAIETGLIGQIEIVPVTGTPLDGEKVSAAQNPLAKIPALERPDGCALYDSRVICQYLDALAGGGFYPQAHRWETLTLEATADGIMDAGVLMIYESRCRPEDMVYAPWVEAQWGKITRALDALEARWMSHLHGPVDIGHVAVGCALGYLDLRQSARNWREGRPSLAAWFGKFAQRDSMQATIPV